MWRMLLVMKTKVADISDKKTIKKYTMPKQCQNASFGLLKWWSRLWVMGVALCIICAVGIVKVGGER